MSGSSVAGIVLITMELSHIRILVFSTLCYSLDFKKWLLKYDYAASSSRAVVSCAFKGGEKKKEDCFLWVCAS